MATKVSILRMLKKAFTTKTTGKTISEVEHILSGLGIDELDILRLYIESKNKAQFDHFSSTSYHDRILLLPHCLRANGCSAKLDRLGYQCEGCGRCRLADITREATQLGYRVFILPGGTIVETILKEIRPRACLAVACLKELVLGSFVCERLGIKALRLTLSRDGCVGTDVNWVQLTKMMYLAAK